MATATKRDPKKWAAAKARAKAKASMISLERSPSILMCVT